MQLLLSIHGHVVHARHFCRYQVQETDLIVKDANGVEHKISTVGNLSVRPGSKISALQIRVAGTRDTLLVINEDTGEFVSTPVIAPGFGIMDCLLMFPGALAGMILFSTFGGSLIGSVIFGVVSGAIAVGLKFLQWRTNLDNRGYRHQQKVIRAELHRINEPNVWVKLSETKKGFNQHVNVLPA